jgi:NAD(P)-dependent dehydrogenase (short-subunit alcohol dehydrogenase family)
VGGVQRRPAQRNDAGVKTAVVTGATSGIGEATALGLARRGLRVAIVARNEAKAQATSERIVRLVPGADLEVFLAELSVAAEVRRVAAELAERLERIDVLINNAGVHAPKPRISADGLDEMLAVNVRAPLLLSTLLLEPLERAAPSRIAIVASEAHRNGGSVDEASLQSLGDYGMARSFRAYGKTKLLVILLAFQLARLLEERRVATNCLCPGAVATNLVDEIPGLSPLARLAAHSPLIRTPEQGARMSIRMATAPEFAEVSGRFVTSTPVMRLVPAVAAFGDRALQARLWERAAELWGLTLPAAAR